MGGKVYMRINYYFRNPKVGYSIQIVFKTIIEQISQQYIIKQIFLPSPFANLRSILKNGLYAKQHQKALSLNHITGDVHYLLLFLHKKRTIVTVHDIMYYYYLRGIKRWLWKILYIYPLKRAACVTFISDFARKQILDIIKIPEDKVFVIPNPVSPDFIFSKKDFNASKPRILHIGVLERKNLERTIIALSAFSCHLRIIGRLNQSIIELLEKYHIEYSNACDLSNEQIVEEYQKADIINFPSLFEGFGMPIIEGQAVGRAVITSKISPMKEVAGEGAALVDPLSVDDIRKAYRRIINDDVYREELIQKGLQNICKYQADIIANQYVQLYKKLL